MRKATIYDYMKLCKSFNTCGSCPLFAFCSAKVERFDADKANEIILNWCEEHPVETRQDRFLKIFPNAKIDNCGTSILCPRWVDKDFKCNRQRLCCAECCKEYWLAEVKENE